MGDIGLLESGGRSVRLPGILDTINRLIGFDLTLRLIDEFGGGDLHIPRNIAEDHPLAKTIGIEAAHRLAGELGRDRWEPFRVPSGHVELTFHFARQLRLKGLPVSEIRRRLLQHYRLRVTERRIRSLVSDIRVGRRRNDWPELGENAKPPIVRFERPCPIAGTTAAQL